MTRAYHQPNLFPSSGGAGGSSSLIAGCDEAGRGCLAGPVVAAAVILPNGFHHPFLTDSKQLSEKKRDILRPIIENEAVAWAVAMVDHTEIDQINILNASIRAMHLAVQQLPLQPKNLLIDGNRFHPFPGITHTCVVGGDAIHPCISAASILAKTYRDEFMLALHQQFPHYGWDKNKGYPTKKHRQGIREFGTSPIHRLSFRLLDGQLRLELNQ
jgi:ribonuclease HII